MSIHQKNTALYTTTVLVFLQLCSFSQKKINDTSTIGEVVVTATRTEKSIGDIPVPIQAITKGLIYRFRYTYQSNRTKKIKNIYPE